MNSGQTGPSAPARQILHLLQKDQRLADYQNSGLKPREVHPAGHMAAALVPTVPYAGVLARLKGPNLQVPDHAAPKVIDLQLH